MKIPFFNRFIQPNTKYPFFIKGRTDIIFIHITKNAGTSITKSFDMNPIDRKNNIRKHYTAKQIVSIIGDEAWKTAHKFTVVRNPWDRMLSYYFYRQRTNKDDFDANNATFEEWLKHYEEQNLLGGNLQMGRTQFDWLTIDENTIDINTVIKFENLETEILQFAKMVNVEIPQLEKINISIRDRDYRKYYSTETKNIISKYYEKDIDTFKYIF